MRQFGFKKEDITHAFCHALLCGSDLSGFQSGGVHSLLKKPIKFLA